MGKGISTCVIAGVTLTGCRGNLIDAEGFFSAYVGSSTWANSGKANSQVVNVGVKGNAFGVVMEHIETSKILSIKSAIATAEAGSLLFAVNIVDDLYTINHYCTRDYTQKKWIGYDRVGNGFVDNLVLRFISQSAV